MSTNTEHTNTEHINTEHTNTDNDDDTVFGTSPGLDPRPGGDPYATEGVFEKVEIRPWRAALGTWA